MFLILPVGVDYTARRYPWVTFTFMGINALVYLLSWVALAQGGLAGEIALTRALGLVPDHPTWYGLFTTLFTHVDFFHFLGNMVYLFLFGACVEDLLGRGLFVAFYLGGGLAADLIHVVASWGTANADLPLIGASGAISACLGGFVVLLRNTKINFRYFVWIVVRAWSGDFWLPAWLVISFWFALDLLSAIASLVDEGSGGGVAFTAHVGGFLGGLGLMALRRAVQGRRGQSTGASASAAVGHARPAGPRVVVVAPTIYLFEGGLQTGPFTPLQVKELARAGSLSAEALYWQEGMTEWRTVSELGYTL